MVELFTALTHLHPADASLSQKYDAQLTAFRHLRNLSVASREAQTLYQQLYATLPQTLQRWRQLRAAGKPMNVTVLTLTRDVFYAKIANFLHHITALSADASDLLTDLQTLKANIERKTAELVVYQAWFHKSKQVDDHQKSALNAWLSSLIAVGKGYGKNTVQHLNAAVRNMQLAKDAVPIWIMRLENALTFFPNTSPAQFDLLIIDEASQCDISSLNLIFRAKKCVIVGDENQTSVAVNTRIFDIDKVNRLLDTYLFNHPFKTAFNVNNNNSSIYTLSGIIYPNIITLTEHFRCLPEIIGYSNQQVYNGQIVPLKTAVDHWLGDPLGLYYVEVEDETDESRPEVVEQVVKLITEVIERFENESLKQLPTVGVLTLDSSNTNHQRLLIKELSKNERIKSYEDKLELLIGTAREFQGDERDWMIFTSTAIQSYNQKGEMRPPRAVTTEEGMRIYNVAASRAREKSTVIHCIHPDAVAVMNPACYRKKLIDYYAQTIRQYGYQQPTTVEPDLQALLKQVDAQSGKFERTVCEFLYRNGYGNYLRPQFKVGSYRIDFGLIKNHKKLAIECDGVAYHSGLDNIQADIHRQLILERAGWQFFRVQSTEWFFENEKVGAALLKWIEGRVGK